MTKKKLSIALRIVLGLAIVAVVLVSVDWRDMWVPEGQPVVEGRILSRSLPEDGYVRFRETGGFEREVPVQEIREGLFRLVRNLKWGLFAVASLPLLLTYSINALRWLILSRAISLELTLSRALRLSFIGLFFNNVVPGATGGDLVRAYYVAKTGTKRTQSVVAVLMDRVVGLTTMAFQAGIVAIFFWREGELRTLSFGIFGLVGCILLATALFYSKRGRRIIGFGRLTRILPLQRLFREADAALFAYRYRKKAVLVAFCLSVISQAFFIFAHFVVGQALGVDCSIAAYLLVIPLASIVSSIPVLPGGWGLGDAAYVYFFGFTGIARAPALAIGVLYRILNVGWSLVGGLFLILGGEGYSRPAPLTSVDPDSSDAGA